VQANESVKQSFQWLNTLLRRSINIYIMYARCINTWKFSSLSAFLCVIGTRQVVCGVVIINLVAH
jgi:hypothetical protein